MTRKPSAASNKSREAKDSVAAPSVENALAKTSAASLAVPRPASPPIVADAPVILIEIDPAVSGGFVHGRFDVMIRGRAISAVALQEIRLQTGDWVASSASFSLPERAVVGVMQDGSPARQRTFQFNLSRPGDGRVEEIAFQLIARTEHEHEYAEDFAIALDPAAATPVSLVSGPARSMAGMPHPHAILYIERGTIDGDGVLAVHGWAIALAPILAVQVFADDERISKAKMGEEREDVAAAHHAYPNARLSGFNLTFQLDEVDRNAAYIRVQVVCPNGFGHEENIPVERLQRRAAPRPQTPAAIAPVPLPLPGPQAFSLFNQKPAYQIKADFRIETDPPFGLLLPGPSPAPVFMPGGTSRQMDVVEQAPAVALRPEPPRESPPEPPSEIRLHCDTAALTGDGHLSLEGWTVCGVGIAQVRVLLNDEDVGLASFGHERPDVGGNFPDFPMAHLSGFRFDRRIDRQFEGAQDLRVVVRNMRGEDCEAHFAVTATMVATAPVVPQPTVEVELSQEQAAEFRFEMDSPVVANGAAVALVTGRLTIDGWLLTRSGIASFEFFLDGQRLGDAHYGLARQDVGSAFPEWPNSLRSGYAFHCPPRSLRDGDHVVELRIRANNGVELVRSFNITVQKADDQQDSTGIRRRVPQVEADMMAAFLDDMAFHPAFRYVMRQDRVVDIGRVCATLDALRLQAYSNWSVLVLAEDGDVVTAMRIVIDDAAPHLASRFTIISPSDADAWAAPLAAPTGLGEPVTLFGLLRAGDEPGADALLELAVASGRHPNRELLYGDEVRISPVSNEHEPFFKPDFSPDLLLSTNYIGRPWVATTALVAKTGVTPASLAADGEYDLVLRCAELATRAHHIPKLLCQRGVQELDSPAQERAALGRMLGRRNILAEILPTPIPGTWRVKRAVPARGKVSIIIPTCAAHGHIETCIASLRAKTSYTDYEIICIDNIPSSGVAWKIWLQQNADKVVEIPDAFNWSVFNNRAVEVADGEFLLFLNDDIEIIQDGWLDAMMEHARRPEVGIVGPQLLYRDGKVQHAGMFLANNGIGRHAFRFAASDDPCYFGLALTQRNVMAVTGACMLVRRETFDRLGKFDEAHEIVNNDLDFCLRAHRAGLLTVFTPYAALTHYELASRASMKDVFDLTHFNAAWKTTFAGAILTQPPAVPP